jgi:cell division protein FtsI (penicillin-binding protein 3)
VNLRSVSAGRILVPSARSRSQVRHRTQPGSQVVRSHRGTTPTSDSPKKTKRPAAKRTASKKTQPAHLRAVPSVDNSPVVRGRSKPHAGNKVRSSRPAVVRASPIIKKRLRWALALLTAILVVLIARVGYLQTISGDDYRAAGLALRMRTTTLQAERGAIFDRNGQEIALSVPMRTLYADPKAIVDPVATAHAIAGLMQFDAAKEQEMAADFAARKSNFSFIARQVEPERAKAVTALRLPGIGSYEEPSRIIVGAAAKAVVGRTDTDGVGTAGLEMQYNDILTGTDGRFVREQDKDGRVIPGASNLEVEPVPGEDLVLTLDRSIQYQVDQLLLDQVSKVSARGGVAIVMDSKSGDIYAMANTRRNDDGTYTSTTGNFASVEAHETGSVAKVFSVAAAINEGAITPETTFHVPGAQVFDKFLIRDAYPHPLQEMSVKEILVKSSNLGTVLAAQRISSETLESYFHAFGFGSKTALQFPDESAGILKPSKKWRGTEKVTVAYGYGFASTAIQLVSAVNVVANNGTYVAPRLVSAKIDATGKTRELEPSSTRPVLSPSTATQMNMMMRDVICYGTGTKAQIPGMTIAGKTGTGYKVQSDGTYGTDEGGRKYFASFVGFLPAENPRVTVLVSIDEPDASSRDRFGGTAAAPVFAKIGGLVSRELRIRPDASTQPCASVDPYARVGDAAH